MPEVKKLKRLKRAVIKEEYVAICGDLIEAIMLNQMIYWSERVKDFDSFIEEEKRQMTGANDKEPSITYFNGWIHKGASELKNEIMSTDSLRTINRKLQDLVDKGFLQRRNNPKSGYDRKYQYRVNLVQIKKILNENGLPLDGYAEYFDETENARGKQKEPENRDDSAICQNDECKRQNVQSTRHSDQSICHCDDSIGHHDAAIPETIIKTTVETSPSYSPTGFGGNNEKSEDEDEHNEKLCSENGDLAVIKNVVDLYNTLCPSYPRIEGITSKRRQAIQVLLNQFHGDADKLKKLFQKVDGCNYLKGNNDLNWKAGFDWIIDPNNAVKILEGYYHDEPQKNPSFDIDEYVKLSMLRLNQE